MNRCKVLTLLALMMLPCAAAFAAGSAARAPIERFEFTEVLNLKGKAQIGRSKVTTWSDELVKDFQLKVPVAQDTTKAATPQARKSSVERRSTTAAR